MNKFWFKINICGRTIVLPTFNEMVLMFEFLGIEGGFAFVMIPKNSMPLNYFGD